MEWEKAPVRNRIKRMEGLDCIIFVFLTALVVVTIWPLLYVVSVSISTPQAVNAGKVYLYPVGFTTAAYKLVFTHEYIPTAYLNTLLYTLGGTAYSLFITICGAYAISRKWLAGRSFIMLMFAFVMLFNGGLIPTYLLISRLGLINNRLVMILPSATNLWNMIIMRTVMQEIPDNIEESAKIDGANDLVILSRIYVPMSKAVIATIGLFYGVANWNGWFAAFIYLRKKALWPVQLILREMLLQFTDQTLNRNTILSGDDFLITALGFRCATIVVVMVPLLCVYPFIQRYFIKGVMIGAIKG